MNNMLNNLNSSFNSYAPSFLSALVLLVAAWLIAMLARVVVRRVAHAIHIDQRLNTRGVAEASGQVAFWFILLLALPGILADLRLQNVLEPIQGMLSRLFAFLPHLFGAILIFVVGWFVAGLVRKILVNLLSAAGIDTLGSRMGLRSSDRYSLSKIVGLFAYVLILVPVIVGAVNALSLDAVSGPLSSMMNTLLAAIPRIFAAVLILGFAIVIGRLIGNLVANLLAGVGFDRIPPKLGFRNLGREEDRSASKAIGTLTFIAILLPGAMEASRALGFAELSTLISSLTVFGGKLLMGAVIFCIGLFLANLAASSIQASSIENARLFAGVARFSVLFIVTAMALGQMGLAREIVNLAFGLLLGAMAIAVAIAFGIGGRETAGRIVARWYAAASPSLVRSVEQTKRDVA
jgi:mechanosensitive ion channel-like protein